MNKILNLGEEMTMHKLMKRKYMIFKPEKKNITMNIVSSFNSHIFLG